MGISAIGNTYTYVYNSQTKKLSTSDGTQDDFVKYFNGELEGSESETLNGFDANRKRDIENLIMCIEDAGTAKNVIAGSTEYEISGEIIDGDTSEYSVNGKKVFTAYTAFSFTSAELNTIFDRWASGEKYACTNDNRYPYPDSVYNKALKRYEESMYQPLSTWKNSSENPAPHMRESANEKSRILEGSAETWSPKTEVEKKADSEDKKLTTYYQGVPMEEWAITDEKYTDPETGISWYVRDGKFPYMIGEDAEKFNKLCEETGEFPVKKFAEMTGFIRQLDENTTAYIGDNGIAVEGKDGRELFVDTSHLTYDMLMNLFDNLSGAGDYFDSSYWNDQIRNVLQKGAL